MPNFTINCEHEWRPPITRPDWMQALPRKRRRKWFRQMVENRPSEVCGEEIEGSCRLDGEDMDHPDECPNCGGKVDADAAWDAFAQARENQEHECEDR